ncbi:uncharacterized protein LOC120083162 [Benincasa hispida]|uniref:uncharacterized protein LOC120083162 n=1 Tax=Benincasa hispida TaxID=102211 RepID=UPI00190016CF|nr:uncharacterized protein LOC120083162 [Benincasa hispida]
MAKPTNQLRILAPPDHDSPPLKPPFRAPSSAFMANNHSTPSKLDSAIAAAPNPSPLSSHIPFSTQKTGFSSQRSMNLNPPPALSVSSMVKSKPHLQKSASGGDEKLSKVCKELGRKKFFYEKKETNDGVDDKRGLCLVVKEKELKEPQKGHDLVSLKPTVSLLRKGGRRRSFAGSQVELSDILAKNGVKVVSVDMQPAMQIHAVDCARKAHDSMEKFTSKTLALSLKREFDGVYGPAWHCIIGTSFGSFVTHSVGGFLYFSMDQKLYILLFKTSVQRAD